MSITVSWDNDEQTILRVEYVAGWTWNDYAAALQEVAIFKSSVAYSLPTINVHHPGSRLPAGSPAPHLQKMLKTFPEPTLAVLVTADRFTANAIRTFMRILGDVEGQDFWITDTLESARQIIFEQQSKS